MAKNVIKGYIGVNDIAKPLFERKYELSKKGIATNLRAARYGLAATTVGNYALFGGGKDSSDYNTIDTYDNNLVRGTATALSAARAYLAATTVGKYALFGGGYYYNYNYTRSNVDVYQIKLT